MKMQKKGSYGAAPKTKKAAPKASAMPMAMKKKTKGAKKK